MRNEPWFRSETTLAFALILVHALSGCGKSTGQSDVTWEFEGDGVRVIERFLDREGDRRHFFRAAHIERVAVSGHVVTVGSKGETFKVYCLDEKQAGELVGVLEETMKKAGN